MPREGRLSQAEFQVMLALLDGAKHGLGIRADVRVRTAGSVDMGPGTLYGAIKRLLRNEWIRDVTNELDPPVVDERRRYYSVTPDGLEAARSEAQRLTALLDIAHDKALFPG